MTDEELIDLIVEKTSQRGGFITTKTIQAALAALREASVLPVWRRMTDTDWLDGKDVVLFVKGMEVSARYCPGEWSHSIDGIEYNSPVWSCFDDAFQLEIEEISRDPAEWFHDGATHWRLPTPPENVT